MSGATNNAGEMQIFEIVGSFAYDQFGENIEQLNSLKNSPYLGRIETR